MPNTNILSYDKIMNDYSPSWEIPELPSVPTNVHSLNPCREKMYE